MCHSSENLLNMRLGTAHRPFPTNHYAIWGRLIHFETAPYFYWIIVRKSSSERIGMFNSRALRSLEPAFSPTTT